MARAKFGGLPLIVLGLAILLLPVGSGPRRTPAPGRIPPDSPVPGTTTPRDVIQINGNSAFATSDAVLNPTAAGTSYDPYIIQNWAIDEQTATGAYGIYVSSTTAHFIVRNCSVQHFDGQNQCGIYLRGVTNGVVENCQLVDNYRGVYMDTCSLVRVRACTIQASVAEGIYLKSGGQNWIEDNVVTDCQIYEGIYLRASVSNQVSRNIVARCKHGIFADMASNANVVQNNTCTQNTLHGIYLYSVANGTYRGNNCSYNGEDGLHVWTSSHLDLSSNVLDANEDGMSLDHTVDATVTANLCTRNTNGLFLADTRALTIQQNRLTGCGIFLFGNNRVDLEDHVIADTNLVNGLPVFFRAGVTGARVPANVGQVILVNANHTVVEDLAIRNASVGVEVLFSHFCVVHRCRLLNNSNHGLYVAYANNGTYSCNQLEDNGGWGAYLALGAYNALTCNNVSRNGAEGIKLAYSDFNEVAGNRVLDNAGAGILLDACDHNAVRCNLANACMYGVHLKASRYNTLARNTLTHHARRGAYLESAHNNTLSCNNASFNAASGAMFSFSDRNEFSWNYCANNSYGLYLYQSDLATVSFNVFTGNPGGCVENLGFTNVVVNNRCDGAGWNGTLANCSDGGACPACPCTPYVPPAPPPAGADIAGVPWLVLVVAMGAGVLLVLSRRRGDRFKGYNL